jgi:hypothetical protein
MEKIMIPPKMRKASKLIFKTSLKINSPVIKKTKNIRKEITVALNKTFTKS